MAKKMKVKLTPELKERLAQLRKCNPSRQEFYDFLDSLDDVIAKAFSELFKEEGRPISVLEAYMHAAVWIESRKDEFKGLK